MNISALDEYNKELNIHANLREHLMSFTIDHAITTINSIKLQASTLAQFTQDTNQLTRTTLVRFYFFYSKKNLINFFK